MIVILTAPSGAGKTTIASLLHKKGWAKPINFTTRKPRGESAEWVDTLGDFAPSERDDYVFLTESQYLLKKGNGDFAETTYYNGNYYGVSRFFESRSDYIVILEPNGRDELERWCIANGFPYKKVFIEIDKQTMINHLEKRGESPSFIKERLNDLSFFFPDDTSIVVDGNRSIDDVVKDIEAVIN